MPETNSTNRLLQCISYLTIVTAWFLIVYVAYMMIYPFRTVEFKDDKFPVLTKQVKQGQRLSYVSNACKYSDVPVTLSRSFVDTIIFDMPTVESTRPLGCSKDIVDIKIPSCLAPGIYYIRVQANYHMNPLRDIIVTHDTEEFEVIANGVEKE